MGDLVKAVEDSGLPYAMGETSYYRAPTIHCRERFRRGDFGEFDYTNRYMEKRKQRVPGLHGGYPAVAITEVNRGDMLPEYIGGRAAGRRGGRPRGTARQGFFRDCPKPAKHPTMNYRYP